MNIQKEKRWEALWFLAVFAFFYIWFAKIHPLIIYDADDWTYIAYVRKATPIWGEWNPAKVFPEVLMPFFSSIILHTLVPLTGDYITGFTVGHALVVSGFITVYTWALTALLRRSFSLSRLTGILAGTLFLVFHFLVFRTEEFDNSHLFYCVDLNCYYNYLLPALAAATIMMHMMSNPRFDEFLASGDPVKTGLFYVVLYFTIFSNLVTSGILAAFAGSRLLLNLLKKWKQFKLVAYVKENTVNLIMLIMWFISAVFELSGGRASSTSHHSLIDRIIDAAYCLKEVIFSCSPLFWLTVLVILILAALQFLLTRKKGDEEATLQKHLITIVLAGAALTLYMLILCALIWTHNLFRSEYQFPLFFYGFLVILLAFGYLLKKQTKLTVLIPLLLVFIISDINTNGKTFKESLMSDYSPAVCADISRDILNQFIAADEAGLSEMTLYTPMHVADPVNNDNWPHSSVLLYRISAALYEQGIISRYINPNVVAEPAYNERFHIPVPTAEE